MIPFLDRALVAELLSPPGLIDALAEAFRQGCVMPARHHHTVRVPGAPDATLLLMPCWREGGVMGMKAANIFPGNADRGLESVSALYLMFDASTGAPLAMFEGGELTAQRTGATSALAARHLARGDARIHLVAGTGRLSRHLARFHRQACPGLARTLVWGRDPAKAAMVAGELRDGGIAADAAPDLDAALAVADIVSCATLATAPLIKGARLRPGQHVDLVGSFTPAMREADDETLRRARLFVDTLSGVRDAGDVGGALAAGSLAEAALTDLAALVRGEAEGRRSAGEITLFKSAGAAIEDLAAAELALARFRSRPADP